MADVWSGDFLYNTAAFGTYILMNIQRISLVCSAERSSHSTYKLCTKPGARPIERIANRHRTESLSVPTTICGVIKHMDFSWPFVEEIS